MSRLKNFLIGFFLIIIAMGLLIAFVAFVLWLEGVIGGLWTIVFLVLALAIGMGAVCALEDKVFQMLVEEIISGSLVLKARNYAVGTRILVDGVTYKVVNYSGTSSKNNQVFTKEY